MKTGFFEEKPGVRSSTRLMSFLLLLFFMAFNLLWINGQNDLTGNLLLFDVFLLVGIFTPKFLHKLAEAKIKDIPAAP
jgi:hypothetical protein